MGGGTYDLISFLHKPNSLALFPLTIWLGLFFIIVMAKLLHPMIVLIAGILGESLIFFYVSQNFAVEFNQFIPMFIFLIIVLLYEGMLNHYQGGEYYQAPKYLKIFLYPILIGITFSFVLYYTAEFIPSSTDFLSEFQLKLYFILYFIIEYIMVLVASWIAMYFIDRSLLPYFPLTEEEKELFAEAEMKAVAEKIDKEKHLKDEILIPPPGELYNQFLPHHPLDEDDHTILIVLGKVRIYLCTRCTAMMFGILITALYLQIMGVDFGFEVPQNVAFIISMTLPILPLLDWGLQALYIRKATTASRLITGGILGISMHLMSIAYSYSMKILIITIVYFVVFGLLYKYKNRKLEQILNPVDLIDF